MAKANKKSLKRAQAVYEAKMKTQNISDELWAAWDKLRGHGDMKAIADHYNVPINRVHYALKFGHVDSEELQAQISEYLTNRINNPAPKPEIKRVDKVSANLIKSAK